MGDGIDDRPTHVVSVRAFVLDRTEVFAGVGGDDEGVGVTGTISAFFITHGQNDGFYVTGTLSGVIGTENGISLSVFAGSYYGRGDPDPYSFAGSTASISIGDEGYVWDSFNNIPIIGDTWRGVGKTLPSATSAGGGLEIGNTFKIYGFQ